MMLDCDQWFYWKAEIDKKTCEKIIKHGKSKLTKELAVVRKQPDRYGKNKKTRDSNIAWINDPWLYDIFKKYFITANEKGRWRFEYDWFEDIQFTSYTKNQHYDWHTDIDIPVKKLDGAMDPKAKLQGKMRKLSCVINLTSPKKFKGGDFYFALDGKGIKRNMVEFKELKEQGTIAIFPSYQHHKVTPITQGHRYSLVIWALGQPFK